MTLQWRRLVGGSLNQHWKERLHPQQLRGSGWFHPGRGVSGRRPYLLLPPAPSSLAAPFPWLRGLNRRWLTVTNAVWSRHRANGTPTSPRPMWHKHTVPLLDTLTWFPTGSQPLSTYKMSNQLIKSNPSSSIRVQISSCQDVGLDLSDLGQNQNHAVRWAVTWPPLSSANYLLQRSCILHVYSLIMLLPVALGASWAIIAGLWLEHAL